MLTGDSLFVGDAARPDLAVEAREGAEGLFHSLRRLVELGDGVEVYPGHVAGSLCGKAMSSKASTTIGFERRFNPASQHNDVSPSSPSPPNLRTPSPQHGADRGDEPRAVHRRQPEPTELAAPPADAQILDVRPIEAFAAGHHHGALSVPVSGTRFSTKAGVRARPRAPVASLASDEDEVALATRGLRSVGHLDIAGYILGGGPESLQLVCRASSTDSMEEEPS